MSNTKTKKHEEEEAELKKLEQEQTIANDRLTETEAKSDLLIEELKEQTTTATKALDVDGKAVRKFHSDTSEALICYATKTKGLVDVEVSKSAAIIELYLWVSLALLAALGLLAGYLVSIYAGGYLFGFSVFWLVISGLSVWELRSKQADLEKRPLTMERDINQFGQDLVKAASSYPEPRHDFGPIRKTLGLLETATAEISSTALSLSPLARKIIEHKERALRRDQFVQKFSYALKKYGFDSYSEEAQFAFKTKSWLIENEESWLDELSKLATERFTDINGEANLFHLVYYDVWSREEVRPVWDSVRMSTAARHTLAQLLVKRRLVEAPNSSEPVIGTVADMLSRIQDFSLEGIRLLADEFFSKLSSFKEDCISVMKAYGIGVVTDKERFITFMPKSASVEDWRDEVMSFLADDILSGGKGLKGQGKQGTESGSKRSEQGFVDVVKLMVLEGIGDARKTQQWKKIIQSKSADSSIPSLSKLLSTKRIPKPFGEFSDEVFIEHLSLVLRSSLDDYFIESIEDSVRELESQILRVKRGMARAAERYRMGFHDFDFVANFVPSKLTDVEQELLAIFSTRSGTDTELIHLFYYDTIGSDLVIEAFRRIAGGKLAKVLADFLVEKQFFPTRPFNENLPTLISTQASFDLASLGDLYNKYDKLMSKVLGFKGFSQMHEIALSAVSPTFANMIKTCPPTSGFDFEDALVAVVENLVVWQVGEYRLEATEHNELTSSACLLMLRLENDASSERLAKKVSFQEYGSRVLYRYIRLVSEALSKTEFPTLKEAAMQGKEKILSDPNYDFFRGELQQGKLVVSASSLLSVRFDELKAEVKNAEKIGLDRKVLENYVESTREFMSAELDVGVVRDFLTMETLSAYLLTIPHKTALINFMNEHAKELEQAGKELAVEEHDNRYLRLLQFETGSGRSTRIGLVPIGMKFEDFTNMVEKLFERARNLSGIKTPMPFYITRIFPSEEALKEIMSAAGAARPLDVVKGLITDHVSGGDAISLLALLEPSAGSKIAFRSVISKHIDSQKNNLLTLSKDLISDVVSKDKALEKELQSGHVDRELFTAYGVEKLSDLCKKIATLDKATSESNLKATLFQRLSQIVPSVKSFLDQEKNVLTDALYKRLRIIGTVLQI